MADKRVDRVMIRVDDTFVRRVEEYRAWISREIPGMESSTAEAIRSLAERGFLAWNVEQKRRRTRIT